MEYFTMNETSRFKLYGLFLSLTHIATHIFWNAYDFNFGLIYQLSTPSENPWPFISSTYGQWIAENAKPIVILYLFTSYLSLFSFLVPKLNKNLLKSVFAVAFLFKLIIYFSSYSFMGNYQYMAHIIFLLFLVSDHKFTLIRIAIILFYFGAGLIKLNYEWISGSALIRETFLPQPLLTLACIYVIILETALVWFLNSNRMLLKIATIAQLILFHLFSWHIVGFYYPVVMICLISVYIITIKDAMPIHVFKNKFYAFYVFIFLAAQAYPKILNKNEALTGEGRMLSLNMLDAKTTCLPSFEIEAEQGFLYLDEPKQLPVRVRCDPLVWMNYGKSLCKDDEDKIYLNIRGKKTTDRDETLTVENLPVCSKDVKYNIFENDWIYNNEIKNFFPDKVINVRHWRQNLRRSGHNLGEFSPSQKITQVDLPIQFGVHSAAKSSPIAIDQERFAVGSDANILFIAGPSGLQNMTYFTSSSYGVHGSAAVINNKYVVIGNYNGILSLIDSSTGKRIWGNKLASAIGSSPIVVNDKIVVSTEVLPNQSRIIEIDLRNGSIRSQSELFDGLAHSSVAYQDNHFVFGTNSGKLISYNLDRSTVNWIVQLPGKIQTTPVIFNKSVYAISSTGALVRVELKTGNIKTKLELPAGTRASPAFDETNQVLIVTLENGEIWAFDESLSNQLWHANISTNGISSPLITGSSNNNIVWTQCYEEFLCGLKTVQGKTLFKIPTGGTFSSSPEFSGKSIIVTLDDQKGYLYLHGN